ncbi:alpha/beta hydrolase family protein [Chloroflexota bacterium]
METKDKMKRGRLLSIGLFIIIMLSLVVGCTSDNRPSTGRVTFQNGDVNLAGNLWIPAGEGPFPAIVIVHGAGKIATQDYKYFIFSFVHQGFATLAYDKRGVGESGGSYSRVGVEDSETVLEDLANDALAGVEFLKGNDRIDPNRIGLFGISQGGWIAPLAASKSPDVAFIALYSGPVCTVGQEIYYSQTTGDDPGGKVDGSSLEAASDMARDFQGPHGFDPLPSLEAIDIPGLWMFGSQDRSIPVALSVENLDALIAQQGKDFSYTIYPNADHNLLDVNTKQFFPAINDAVDWIVEKFGD